MDADLKALEQWVAPLLRKLEPTERRRLARMVGQALRRSQSQRITQQRAPDGTPYPARKNQLRDKRGRIKRQKMFAKLRQAKYLKVMASDAAVSVGFTGRAARIARVHQEGRMDMVRPGGPRARYEKRVLLGLTEPERTRIRDYLLNHLLSRPSDP